MLYQAQFSGEFLERLNEAYFEGSQNDARPNSNNYGSGNDNISVWDMFFWTVSSGAGNDTILFANDDRPITVYAGSGNDYIEGGYGNDTIYAGSGDDWVHGGNGDDIAYGGSGNDHIDDELQGNDTFYGGSGHDHIEGGYGNDMLSGGVDNDWLYGQHGNDTLYGGFGNDNLNGGRGQDILTGNEGTDTFWFGDGTAATSSPSPRYAPDQITDLSRNGGDHINLTKLDSNMDVAGFQNDFFLVSGQSQQIGAIWIEGIGADRTVYVNTSVKDGAEIAINVHLTDSYPSLSGWDFEL